MRGESEEENGSYQQRGQRVDVAREKLDRVGGHDMFVKMTQILANDAAFVHQMSTKITLRCAAADDVSYHPSLAALAVSHPSNTSRQVRGRAGAVAIGFFDKVYGGVGIRVKEVNGGLGIGAAKRSRVTRAAATGGDDKRVTSLSKAWIKIVGMPQQYSREGSPCEREDMRYTSSW